MSGLLNNSLFLSTAAAAGGYQIERSLRFNSSDSAFCSRTPAVAGKAEDVDLGGVGEEEWTQKVLCLIAGGGVGSF
jgi:hypothetical protein